MRKEKYVNKLSFKNKIMRLVWNIVYALLFRPFSLPIFKKWRIFLLRLFGAQIGPTCRVMASVKVWAPWNLVLGKSAALGFDTICYNPGKIIIGDFVTVSQRAHLCAASHDITSKAHELITEPIIIKSQAWIATDTFIGMGVTIGEGAVVGARAAVFKDVEPWAIVGGNPAKFIKKRIIHD